MPSPGRPPRLSVRQKQKLVALPVKGHCEQDTGRSCGRFLGWFQLIPSVRRTWAPRGQTPCVRHRYRRDRISTRSHRPPLGSGPIHRRLIVREFVAAHSRLRVHLFPAYAPELNPAEFVWTQADRELANGAADDLAELRHHLGAAIRRLRQSQLLLRSCIHASGLPWPR